jgi:hypothetical protein
MAIIRTAKYAVQVPALTEDPYPNSGKLYFQNEAFSSANLSVFFDKTIQWNAASAALTTFGYSTVSGAPEALGGILQLKGEVTFVRHTTFSTQAVQSNNLDQAPFASMDPARPIIQTRYDTDGVNNQVLISYNQQTLAAAGDLFTYYRRVNVGTDSSTGYPIQNTTNTAGYTAFPVYRNPSTGNLLVVANYHVTGYVPGATAGAHLPNMFSAATPTLATSTPAQTSGTLTVQFVGVSSVDGSGIFLNNTIGNDYTQTIYKYVESGGPGYVTLISSTTAPSVDGRSGGSAGGARTTPTGGTFQPKFASRTFTDPNAIPSGAPAGQTGFYVPYFDTAGAYHPHYFVWNRTADTFQRFSNVTTVFGSGTQSTYFYPDTVTASSVSTTTGMQRIVYNESFVFSGTRYLTLMQFHGAGGIFDGNTFQRTFMTYAVSSTDYTQTTFHSACTIPSTPKNICWLNDARTLMAVIAHNYTYIYSFNSAVSGWNLTASYNYQFNSIGRDSLGRVWAQDSGPAGYGRIHLLSGSMPATINVTPAANSYNYSGATISTTYAVDTYDITGARVAANVTLTSTGSSIVFYTSNILVTTPAITVTTSASATTTVNAAVVSAGVSTITTTVTL